MSHISHKAPDTQEGITLHPSGDLMESVTQNQPMSWVAMYREITIQRSIPAMGGMNGLNLYLYLVYWIAVSQLPICKSTSVF